MQTWSINTASPDVSPCTSDGSGSRHLSVDEGVPLVATRNPPLQIMAQRKRRVVKGRKNQHIRRQRIQVTHPKELRGFIAILLTVALVVALVIVVDKLFLRRGGRIGNMELHVSNANMFVEHIAQAWLKRYPRLGKPELNSRQDYEARRRQWQRERGREHNPNEWKGKYTEFDDELVIVEFSTLSYCLGPSRIRISCG